MSNKIIHSAFRTDLTDTFGIKHPIMLAGMNVASGPELAAAVCNAGGLGVIGGLNYTPKMLRTMIQDLKSKLIDKTSPFGVDLLLPKVGDGARKTNYDYTKGQLDELINIIIEEKASLFVSAIGVPSKHTVKALHAAGILVMNMIGSPKHVQGALNAGVDIICAQGGEGGGHTGDIGTMVLIPAVVNAVVGHLSPLTGRQIQVIAAGGIYDGRTLIAALSMGASGVWVGTRFIASVESSAPKAHKDAVLSTTHDQTMKTLVYTGRPLRIAYHQYAHDWETLRKAKMDRLLAEGTPPVEYDQKNMETGNFEKDDLDILVRYQGKPKPYPHLLGQVAGSINKIETAADIINNMITEAIAIVNHLSEINTFKLPSISPDTDDTPRIRSKL